MGATLYRLLAGKAPYGEEDNDMVPDIVGVPPRLMRVIRRSLSLEQRERYQSAREMREALYTAISTPEPKVDWDGIKTKWQTFAESHPMWPYMIAILCGGIVILLLLLFAIL